jgi:hypothetical protein
MGAWSKASDGNDCTYDEVSVIDTKLQVEFNKTIFKTKEEDNQMDPDEYNDLYNEYLCSHHEQLYQALQSYFTDKLVDECMKEGWRATMVGIPLYYVRLLTESEPNSIWSNVEYPKALPDDFPEDLRLKIVNFIKYKQKHGDYEKSDAELSLFSTRNKDYKEEKKDEKNNEKKDEKEEKNLTLTLHDDSIDIITTTTDTHKSCVDDLNNIINKLESMVQQFYKEEQLQSLDHGK